MIYEYNYTGHRYSTAHRLCCISAPEDLAFKKAKANPSKYNTSGNAYNVLSSDGSIMIEFFYGINGQSNPIIKSSFPKY